MDDEWQSVAVWHTVIAFGRIGQNVAKFMKKGRQIAIVGRLTNNKWQDKNGSTRVDVEIIADEIEFLGGADNGGN